MGAADARSDSASCFQPSGVVGGVFQAVRSGWAMICCSSGLTVLGTGIVLAGTSRGANGADCANAAAAAKENATTTAVRQMTVGNMVVSDVEL